MSLLPLYLILGTGAAGAAIAMIATGDWHAAPAGAAFGFLASLPGSMTLAQGIESERRKREYKR